MMKLLRWVGIALLAAMLIVGFGAALGFALIAAALGGMR